MTVEKAKELRRKGHSYREISKIVNKSIKFVHSKVRGIKFDKEGKRRYHKEVKGITKRIKNQLSYLTLIKVRIIAHLLFDGTLYKSGYHYFIRYINASKDLIDQFASDIKETYGVLPTSLEISKNKKGFSCYKITFKSKLIFEDLQKYFTSYSTSNESIFIPKKIIKADKKIKLEFLKAFFEDEGSISFKGRIMGDLKSEKIIKQIVELLKEFGLEFRLCRYDQYTGYMYKIYLPKKQENLKKFYNLGLFEKAIVTHGHNLGRKKLDVLKEHLIK